MSHRLSKENIAILAGGPSCEREISLISGKSVLDALLSRGFNVWMLDPQGDFVPELKRRGATLVFNAVHGTFGEDGTLQKLLDLAGIPYTGCGAVPSENAFDKSKAQGILKKNGVLIAPSQNFYSWEEVRRQTGIPLPLVVKPAKAGSSVGISIVLEADRLQKACEEAFKYSDCILLESYLAGRELTVGILGEEPLPVVEVIAQRKFYDFEAKYKDAETRYEYPAKLTETEEKQVVSEAMKAYQALGCEVMARIDLILSDGKPYVLEANTIPGLTPKSLLPKAAKAKGIDFPDLCVKILELSMNRMKV